jgi:hypothetical protein
MDDINENRKIAFCLLCMSLLYGMFAHPIVEWMRDPIRRYEAEQVARVCPCAMFQDDDVDVMNIFINMRDYPNVWRYGVMVGGLLWYGTGFVELALWINRRKRRLQFVVV